MKAFFLMVLLATAHGVSVSAADEKVPDAQPSKLTIKHPLAFEFNGGQLRDLVRVIKADFGVDLEEVATVPNQMLYSIRVPKMKLKAKPAWHLQDGKKVSSGNSPEGLNFTQVLNLYNEISAEADPSMGKWLIREVQDGDPGLVMWVPPPSKNEDRSFQIKAFAIPGWKTDQVDSIEAIIREESERLLIRVQTGDQPGLTPADIRGELRYHRGAGILVATGGRVFVEMAGAIIEAARRKADIVEIPIPTRPATNESE